MGPGALVTRWLLRIRLNSGKPLAMTSMCFVGYPTNSSTSFTANTFCSTLINRAPLARKTAMQPRDPLTHPQRRPHVPPANFQLDGARMEVHWHISPQTPACCIKTPLRKSKPVQSSLLDLHCMLASVVRDKRMLLFPHKTFSELKAGCELQVALACVLHSRFPLRKQAKVSSD